MRLAIGWTILHSLWQGTLAALLLAVALGVLRSSRARYASACLAMAGTLAAFGITLVRMMNAGAAAGGTIARHVTATPPGAWERVGRATAHFNAAPLLAWLTPLWIAGVVLFHLYSLAGWVSARRMLRRGVCAAAETWQQRLSSLRQRLRLTKPVRLVESSLADVPVVIGYLCPVILVPVGMLTGMPAAQIEGILLHELAHIRRRDYLVNLLQVLVEGFLFYHPAVWWISSVIRAERENCCDDLAVTVCGDAHGYAATLAALEENRWAAREAVLAANGGNLMKRVRRLLNPRGTQRTVLTPVLSAVILTVTAAIALTAWQAKSQEPAPKEGPYQKWLNQDVAYIIEDRERAAFEKLTTDDEREMFIEQFWERRNPTPGTGSNPFKQEHYRRIAYANDHFEAQSGLEGWRTDRGRTYILYGPPDEIESHPVGGKETTYPFEMWRYREIKGVGANVVIEFVDPNRNGEYHMTTEGTPLSK